MQKNNAPTAPMAQLALTLTLVALLSAALSASALPPPERSPPMARSAASASAAFIDPHPTRSRTVPPFLQTSSFPPLGSSGGDNDDGGGSNKDAGGSKEEEAVKVGTSEYYRGFVSRPVDSEPEGRVTGDNVLGPTLKFAGGAAAILVLLTVGFLASNGII